MSKLWMAALASGSSSTPTPTLTALKQIATRVASPSRSVPSSVTGNGGTTRIRHVAASYADQIRVMYSASAGFEYQIRASLDVGMAGYRLTFGGSETGLVPAGGFLYSDVLDLGVIKPGTELFTRNWANYIGPNVGSYQDVIDLNVASGEWGAANTDLSPPGSTFQAALDPGSATRVPAQIIGRAPAGQRSLVFTGDSIVAMSPRPWPSRIADRLAIPWMAAGLGGDAVVYAKQRRAHRIGPDFSTLTHLIHQFGTNDMAPENANENDYIENWIWHKARGIKVIQSTILPHASTTDGWTTLAGQSPVAYKETKRLRFNAWFRDGAPILNNVKAEPGTNAAGTVRAGHANHPLHGILEICTFVESSLNSGIWRVDQGTQLPGDGLHPGARAHELIAAGVDLSLFA